MTLGLTAVKLREAMDTHAFRNQFTGNEDAEKAMGARKLFGNVLDDFAGLHLSFDDDEKEYKGHLAGMDVVKKKIRKKGIQYFKPGDIVRDLGDLEGIKIYVLGPPESYEEVKTEAGGKGNRTITTSCCGKQEVSARRCSTWKPMTSRRTACCLSMSNTWIKPLLWLRLAQMKPCPMR